MASYKVPQDVEAEDKLIGPFSFRQFIYLIVAAIAIFVAYMLAQIFIGLVIIPLPIIVFFLALALPLRKDQPMESYLLAMVQFNLKPRVRLWNPDGSLQLVEITAPPVTDEPQLKDLSGEEASEKLAYLAQIIDTGGWASRGVMDANVALNDTVVAEAQQAEDVLDNASGVGQSFDQMIASSDASRKQAMLSQLQQSIHQTTATQQPQQITTTPQVSTTSPVMTTKPPVEPPTPPPAPAPATSDTSQPAVSFNPYPSSMHQRIIKPAHDTSTSSKPVNAKSPAKTVPKPSEEEPSPDIIRLANNNDLSISAIAREAHRLADQKDGEEVVISLR